MTEHNLAKFTGTQFSSFCERKYPYVRKNVFILKQSSSEKYYKFDSTKQYVCQIQSICYAISQTFSRSTTRMSDSPRHLYRIILLLDAGLFSFKDDLAVSVYKAWLT